MPRTPLFQPTSLPPRLTYERLLRELNARFGTISRALAAFAEPFPLTYGTTVVVNAVASTYFTLTVTNGVGFTIAFPTNLAVGQPIVLDILNSSGGALGVVTFGAGYLLAGAFVAPADTKRRVYAFRAVTATTLVEQHRSAADI